MKFIVNEGIKKNIKGLYIRISQNTEELCENIC